MKIANQLHPPRPKKRGEVELNKKCSIVKKDGVSTTVVGIGTKPACDLFVERQYENAKRLGIDLKGKYTVVNHEIKSSGT